MAFAGVNWDNVDPTNKFPYTYSFSKRLQTGDTIASVEWELTVVADHEYRGTDDTPSDHLSAEANTDTTATVWIDGLLANTRYRLTASIITANGVHDDLWSYISCDPAP